MKEFLGACFQQSWQQLFKIHPCYLACVVSQTGLDTAAVQRDLPDEGSAATCACVGAAVHSTCLKGFGGEIRKC